MNTQADGSRKPIKDIQLGDKVLATDPVTGRTEAREVTDVRSHASLRTLVEVTVDTDAGGGTVVATDEHPFWVASDKRWSNAIDLKPGHKLATADNRDATITATRTWSEVRRVYNLTIDGLHTYHVVAGSQSLLVHNAAPHCPVVLDTGAARALTSSHRAVADRLNITIGDRPLLMPETAMVEFMTQVERNKDLIGRREGALISDFSTGCRLCRTLPPVG